MWVRTIRFIFKEGFSNFFRNKLMFFASCAIITAALLILGVFLLVIYNIDANVKSLDEKPQIQVYSRYELTDAEVDGLERELRAADGIREFTRVTRDEAYERARDLLGEDSDILDGIDPDFLPVSFIVKMEDPVLIEGFVRAAEQLPTVESVAYPKRTIDLISKVSSWTKLFGAVLAGMPILFAVVVVSNTIRIAVSERRGEIGIMRYIGATERLIRWPFVVEGMIIGIVGATVAFLLTGFGYRFVENSFNLEVGGISNDLIRLVSVSNVSSLLLAVYLLIGVGVGMLGSARSIRKYLRV